MQRGPIEADRAEFAYGVGVKVDVLGHRQAGRKAADSDGAALADHRRAAHQQRFVKNGRR